LGASLNVYQINNGHVVPYQTYASPIVSTLGRLLSPSWQQLGVIFRRQLPPDFTVTGYSAGALPVNAIGRDGIAQATIWDTGNPAHCHRS
jgi:hypothetical protein